MDDRLVWISACPLCAKIRGKLPSEPFGKIMKTDWNLIREMMSAAIDKCERIEARGYSENDRDASALLARQDVSVHEYSSACGLIRKTFGIR